MPFPKVCKKNMMPAFWMLLLCLVLFPTWAGACKFPSSRRSREVIARVRPSLEAQLADKGFSWGAPVFLRIFKDSKTLEVWLQDHSHFRLFTVYPVCTFGGRGLGPKTVQGDGFAPEGFYYVGPQQLNPWSRYHLAINLGYPNAYDRYHGHTGDALMIHGACVSIGCFAMTDRAIERIYALADAALRNGQPFFRVHIFPFTLEKGSLQEHRDADWFEFWQNLQVGYAWFETFGRPPDVTVRQGRYMFSQTLPENKL
jgi:murein L,D-transpeptidase YafK